MKNLNKKIFTCSNPFNLIDGLWSLLEPEINNFEKTLLFLPSHRAIRLCQKMLAEKIGTTILPEMIAIGTGEDNEDQDIIDSQIELFLVIKLLQKKSPELHVRFLLPMAESLIKMFNTMTVEDLEIPDWTSLIDDTNLAKNFEDKAKFFDLTTRVLPAILASDFNSITKAKSNIVSTKNWKNKLDNYNRIIVCGSTASAPITSDLIQAVYHNKNGKILLPGNVSLMTKNEMDLVLKTESEHHPYFGIFNLLKHLDLEPNDIEIIDTGDNSTNKFLSDAFYLYGNPESKTELNKLNISNIECDDEAVSSKLISLIVSEKHKENKSIAVISPDIGLTNRLKVDFENYGISADFSSGKSGSEILIGQLFLRIAKFIKTKNNPIDILSLLKHKWVYFGESEFNHKLFVSILENDVFSGLYLVNDLTELPSFIDRIATERHKKFSDEFLIWIDKLVKLNEVKKEESCFNQILDIFDKLTIDDKGQQDSEIYSDESKQVLIKLEESQNNIEKILTDLDWDDYISLLNQTLSGISIREAKDTNIFVMGTQEARMIKTDIIILAGLNDGLFPKLGFSHPWLNNKMADKIGWPKAIRKIGLMALDFITLSSAPQVYWVRSKKLGSSMASESRFLSRVKILLNKLKVGLSDSNVYLESAKELNTPLKNFTKNDKNTGIFANPPLEYRPQKIAATNIEKWRNNPYEFYASKILSLYPKDEINRDVMPMDFGNLIHNVLEKIDKDITEQNLIEDFQKEALKYISKNSYLYGFWNQRFVDISKQVIDLWASHKSDKSWTEYTGEIKTDSGIVITAKADKIWQNNDTSYIMDIKTGSNIPNITMMKNFKKPQLAIEALILKKGGYTGLKNTSAIVIQILQGSSKNIKVLNYDDSEDIDNLIEITEENLNKWLYYYNNEKNPYKYRATNNYQKNEEKYAHLARVKEFL